MDKEIPPEEESPNDEPLPLVSEEELDAAEEAGGCHSMDDVFKLLERK